MPADAHAPPSLSVVDDFDAVYSENMPAVLRYLRRRLGDAPGEDATHDVFVRAFAQRSTFDPARAPVIAWLFGIAANVIADHHRQEARRLKTLERAARSETRHHASEHEPHQLPRKLSEALGRLSLQDRETLLLVVWGELSYDETAAALSIPVGTVRSRISRARSALRADLAPTDPIASTQAVTPKDGSTHA